MTEEKREIERSLGQRTAALSAIALRSIRTGTGPFLFESAVTTLESAAAGVAGAFLSGNGAFYGAMIRSPNTLGNIIAKTATGAVLDYGALAMVILSIYKLDLHFNQNRNNQAIKLRLANVSPAQGLIAGAFAFEILSVLSTYTGHELLKSHFPESELPLRDIMIASATGSAIMAGVAILIALVLMCRSCLIYSEEKCTAYAEPKKETDIELAAESHQYSTASESAERSDDPDATNSSNSLSASLG